MTAPDWSAATAAEARKLPKTDRLLEAAVRAGMVARVGHGAVVGAIRDELERIRGAILAGAPCPTPERIEEGLLARLRDESRGSLRPVVNATGVVIHTNLGRAPLSGAALAAMTEAARGYVSLEYDLEAGERGDRYHHAEGAIRRLTGAEAAVVVNNNASAVLLALAALIEGEGGGRAEVVVSRGQLVEIGGGFRIPDVLRRSGAALVEVGTTNRTYASDFEAAIGAQTRVLLSVHRSNFKVSGFVHDTTLEELVELARRHGLRVVDDLCSGALLATEPYGLGHEPTVMERIAAGADVVCFSGDKLLGGPQAGILAGRAEAIERVRRNPLLRALRVDKVTLAGLAATLAHYERGAATAQSPVWRALATTPAALQARARGWLDAIRDLAPGAAVVEGCSAIGGGTLPDVTLPTALLALPPGDADALAARLRRGDPPVVGRIEDGRVL
ncbi:MAG TPA: L-seryl-tRNA(Sec) selenium transferase, partial [Anaeromyxobacteraceae bacterium]|nr:L-seryl-tRNA(Sec) selenium transferase [Anaeromyxobacteraceae bacterium]